MELSTADFEMVECLLKKLTSARSLANSLDLPDDIVFSASLKADKALFPLTFAKYHALRWKKVSALKPAQKNELQALLETDMAPIVEEARLAAQQPKTIHGEVLPADLGACSPRLEELMAAKKQKIKDLQKEREEVDDARQLVEMMKESQDIFDQLETRAKRQKVSAV
jgi:hypothetical protein